MTAYSGDSLEKISSEFDNMGRVTDESRRNLAVLKSTFAALLCGDQESYWALFAADALTAEPMSLPYGGNFIGSEGARKNAAVVLGTQYRSVHYEVLEMAASADLIFALLNITFTKKSTGESLEMPVAEMWRFKDGKIIENRPFIFDAGALARMSD